MAIRYRVNNVLLSKTSIQISKRDSCTQQEEDDDELSEMLLPDLSKVLSKCAKEEKTDEKGQPLFIDELCDRIKCKCRPTFKGSIEARVINQHCKSSKTHIAIRRKLLGEEPSEGLQGLQSIRNYFKPTCSDNNNIDN